jgi:circadian clock protein KaiB
MTVPPSQPPHDNPDADADDARRLVEAGAELATQTIVLRLYVVGSAPLSSRAIANTRRLCEQYLAGRYRLEIIDLREQPRAAVEADLVAAPTLVKALPLPLRRFIGDLSRSRHVLVALDIAQP